MAHTLFLSYGGSSILLNSGSITLRHYVPKSPNLSTIDTNTILKDGGKRTLTTRRNVTESCQVLVKAPDGAASDIANTKHTIQSWLTKAEHVNEVPSSASRVYVEYAPDGLSSCSYRSELLGGKVNVNDDSLDTRWTVNRAVELDIAWTRRYYWEGDAQTLTLFNTGCTATTATVRNQNPLDYEGTAGCYNNWVQIAGSHINGEIPTPAHIKITNTSGTMSNPHYYLFYGSGERMIDFPTTLEAEDVDGWILGNATDYSNACSSGGYYSYKDLDANTASFQQYGYWSLPSASMDKFAGHYYNIMAATQTEPKAGSAFIDMQLTDTTGVYEFGTSQGVKITEQDIQTFGTIQIPPIIQHDYSLGENRLYIRYKNFATSACDLNLDCLYVMPTDGYKYLKLKGLTQNGYFIIDDGMNEVVYDHSGGYALPRVSWKGRPIMLVPDEDGRLYFIMRDSTDYDPFRTHSITVQYRPRRLTI